MNLSLGGLFFQSFREHAHLHNITLKYSSHDTTVVKARLESQSFSGWQFVPYKSLSVTWLKSEAVTMLSAEIFHMPVLDSWGSIERAYTRRVRARSGNAMNDAKWKRGRQALNNSFCAYHVSYYKCIYYTFYYKEGQVKASNCYWISLSGNLHSCSLSWTLVLDSVWKERGQVEISTPHTHTRTHCTPCYTTILFPLNSFFTRVYLVSKMDISCQSVCCWKQFLHFLSCPI